MKLRLVVLLLIGVLLAGVFAPVTSGSVSAAPQQAHVASTHTQAHAAAFDKTKFVLHMGAAAFLIHYVYKKYKQGKLGRHHIFTSIKAAAAALIAYHELKTAYNLAKGSNSKTLQILISPLTALTGTVSAMASKLKRGDTSGVTAANSQQDSLQSTAGKNGYSYKDAQPSGFSGF